MISALSTMVAAQRDRFSDFWDRLEKARANLRVGGPKLRRPSTYSSYSAELYGLDGERLQLHISMLADVTRANRMPLRTLGDAVALMQSKALCIGPLVPEAGALLRLTLVPWCRPRPAAPSAASYCAG